MAARYPTSANRIVEITNGYDPADLSGIPSSPKPEGVRRIVYSGSLFSHHRDVLRAVLQAVLLLGRDARRSLELVFVGQAYDGAVADVEALGLGDTVRFTGYLPTF